MEYIGHMQELMNLVRREAMRVMRNHTRPRVGIVTAYNPKTHMVKVKLQPKGNETSWIPVSAHHMGNGFGVMVAPKIGDQVEVGFQGGDSHTPRVVGRFHSDQDKPPQIEAGEVLVKHESGAGIYINKDGDIILKAASGRTVYTNEGDLP